MPRVLRWLMLAGMMLALAACGGGGEPTATPPPTETPAPPTPSVTDTPQPTATPYFGRGVEPSRQTGALRVIHGASGAPAIDLFLNGQAFVTSLGFGLASGLTTVLPEVYILTARERGTESVLAEAVLRVQSSITTEVVFAPAELGYQLVVSDGPERALQAGMVAVRVVNAVNSGGAFDVLLNGSAIGTEIPLGGVTSPFTFRQGDITAELVQAGETVFTHIMRARELTSVVLIVAGDAERPRALVYESPTASLFSLRVINMSPDAGAIDVFLDDLAVATNLAFETATGFTEYSTALTSLRIVASGGESGATVTYIDGERVAPRPGSSVALAIIGPASDMTTMWIEQDTSPVPSGQSRVVFAHASPGVPSLRVGVNSTELASVRPFIYGQVSEPVLFDAGSVRLFLRDASRDGSVIELQESFAVPPGQSIIYFVTSIQDGSAPPTFSTDVLVDFTLIAEPLETPVGSFRVRYANALAAQPIIDVRQDGALAAPALAFGAVSPLSQTAGTTVDLNVMVTSSAASVLSQRYRLASAGTYTVFIYGAPESSIRATAIRDAEILDAGGAGTVRLVNLSPDSFAEFGLAAAPASTAILATPNPALFPTATPSSAAPEPTSLPRLPAGTELSIRATGSGQGSRAIGLPANSMIYIVNNDQEVAATLPLVAFAPGTHTDIVVYQYRTEARTRVVVAPIVYTLP